MPPPHAPVLTTRPRRRTSANLALFFTAAAWLLLARTIAAHAAAGLIFRFNPARVDPARLDLTPATPLLSALFYLFLLIVGFTALHTLSRRLAPLADTLGLPGRPSARREFALGAAIGWGAALAIVLPLLLFARLHLHLWFDPHAFLLLLLNLTILAVATLAAQVALRGYPFRLLIDAIGPSFATILMVVALGVRDAFLTGATGTSILVGMAFALLLAVAWLRTHALWLAWGLHFAWAASLGLLFGLPVRGSTELSAIVDARTAGPLWLTGGDFGPEAARLTFVVLIAALVILIAVTRDYAWAYTHPPLIPAGLPVEVAPPAAHTAMEQSIPPAPAALVQILPTTPQNLSTAPPSPLPPQE